MNRAVAAVVVVCLVAFTACGGGDESSPSTTIPDYAGNWSGTYSVTSCAQSGQMALVDICGSATLGKVLQHRFEFAQTSRTLTGQFYLGGLLFQITPATIATDGSVTVQGTVQDSTTIVNATWALQLSGPTISGTVAQTWNSTGLTGVTTVNGSTSSTVHASSVAPTAVRPTSIEGVRDAIGQSQP